MADLNLSDDDIDNIVDNITNDAKITPSQIQPLSATNNEVEDDIDDELTTEYLAKFDPVEGSHIILTNLLNSLPYQPNQDMRLAVALDYIKTQQRLNEQIFDLLVSMNNVFARPANK